MIYTDLEFSFTQIFSDSSSHPTKLQKSFPSLFKKYIKKRQQNTKLKKKKNTQKSNYKSK